MRPLDWAIFAVLVLIVGAAVFFAIRQRKKGKRCCGDCAGCGDACEKREKTADRF